MRRFGTAFIQTFRIVSGLILRQPDGDPCHGLRSEVKLALSGNIRIVLRSGILPGHTGALNAPSRLQGFPCSISILGRGITTRGIYRRKDQADDAPLIFTQPKSPRADRFVKTGK